MRYPVYPQTRKWESDQFIPRQKWCARSLFNQIFSSVLLVISCLCGDGAQAGGMTIAVWDFDSHEVDHSSTPSLSQLSRALSEVLIEQLLSYPGVQVVERMRLREIFDEQKLGSSALADEDTRLKLGHIAGAQHMIFGSLIRLGGVTRVDVRLVSVQTSQVLSSHETSTMTEEISTAMEEVARTLATSIGHGKTSSENIHSPNANPATLMVFDQGLALMDQKDFLAAIDVFKRILTSSAGFAPAERQLQIALEKLTRQ